MPRCLRCGLKFSSQRKVLYHMNQPQVACRNTLHDLVQLIVTSRRRPPNPKPGTPTASTDDIEMADQYLSAEDDSMPEDGGLDLGPSVASGSESIDDSCEERYMGASNIYGRGSTFMDRFDSDKFAGHRRQNLYYPFASKEDWEMALFLLGSSLSMADIDRFLSLQLTRGLPLSYRTASELRGRAELLPAGPKWTCKPLKTTHPTKTAIKFYYRDSLECVESLFGNPLFANDMHLVPLRLFKTSEKLVRRYTEWMSGNVAWDLQNNLPEGATLLGMILSSDKTNISVMTGDRSAHPLLISLANISMDVRMKSSNRAFFLLALLPVPKFLHKNKRLRGVLESRLLHQCIDIAVEPLKVAASIGVMMSDARGFMRHCFTPLAAYIVDTPESAMLAGVGGKTSAITMATFKQFGDPFRHEPRTASTTISQLQVLETIVDPCADVWAYFKTAYAKFRLNGVHRPFWRNWASAEPSTFLTPEVLHHLHRKFWDHDMKWCIRAVGAEEIDFRFSILQPRTGYRHFKDGVSKLKQVTGRVHRDLQRHIVPIIAGAVPDIFLIAIRASLDFQYLVQAPLIDDIVCDRVLAHLKEFHDHKHAIIESGARVGKGNAVIDNWHIPKLELMQSVVANIKANGVPIQWSADVTEHEHIVQIKAPARAGNNQNHDEQICRSLDRSLKCDLFDLATSTRAASLEHDSLEHRDMEDADCYESDTDSDTDDESTTKPVDPPSSILGTTQRIASRARRLNNFFDEARRLASGEDTNAPIPHRTFSCGDTAFNLNRVAAFTRMRVDEVVALFKLPDLWPALHVFLQRLAKGDVSMQLAGSRRNVQVGDPLPFEKLEVWTRVRMQSHNHYFPDRVLPAQTLNACPPSEKWPLGRYDSVIINTDPSMCWPRSGFNGHCIGQIRLIMRAVEHKKSNAIKMPDAFLAYIERFEIVSQPSQSSSRGPHTHPAAQMCILKRSKRADGSRFGDIVFLSQLRTPVELTPRFSQQADSRLTKSTSLEYSSEFWLTKYFEKDFYYRQLS